MMYKFTEETASLFDELCQNINASRSFIHIPCQCCVEPDRPPCDGNAANDISSLPSPVMMDPLESRLREEQMDVDEDCDKSNCEKKGDTAVNAADDINESYICFKEILHSEFDEDALLPFINLFNNQTMSTVNMDRMCSQLELSALPLDGAIKVGLMYLNLEGSICYNHCICFIRHCLLPKAMDATKNLPQNFINLITAFLHKHQSPTTDGLFQAMFQDEKLESPQADLSIKSTKDEPNLIKHQLLSLIIKLQTPWKKAHIVVLEHLIKSKAPIEIDNHTASKLCCQIATSSQAMSDNLKFGKLALEVINKYGKQLSRDDIDKLGTAMVPHKTFMKKSVETALKKLTNQ